ncbi:LPXTG cell wall anchor domain-containing protein [Streptomyces sp. R302]|uniref:LPXTG cell wall anchor domain-containing protein n=1 Tax=unclassified Streptomyces TaxID=2593676 RepID=UPI00145F61CC|nr:MULTISPECIES: LPXTG cell wall anchor domain-containing protein [unclassified Streptomyces]NML53131.1 LPXTG cell wall anchor domain-containing protein [Streptomyces sp. R301]NML82814.1 LPXTG cell wall anchor domain-containing protein [Streptomyces sp. R302]
MRRSLIPAATLVAAMAGSLALATTASATSGEYELKLHQATPIKAADFEQGECPDTIPADKDGWHFVIPGGGTDFVKLTVTFDNGAPIEITSFGPPKDDHAYVASEAGAELTSAVATVNGEQVKFFNLSHTCAAEGEETTGGAATGETTTGETTTGETTTGETTTGETTTGETTTGESTATGETTSTGETTATGETTSTGETTATGGSSATGGTTTGETTATGGDTTTGDVKGETDTKGGSEEGNLAETGSSAPVGVIAGVAAALAAAGAFLVLRRRKAVQG